MLFGCGMALRGEPTAKGAGGRGTASARRSNVARVCVCVCVYGSSAYCGAWQAGSTCCPTPRAAVRWFVACGGVCQARAPGAALGGRSGRVREARTCPLAHGTSSASPRQSAAGWHACTALLRDERARRRCEHPWGGRQRAPRPRRRSEARARGTHLRPWLLRRPQQQQQQLSRAEAQEAQEGLSCPSMETVFLVERRRRRATPQPAKGGGGRVSRGKRNGGRGTAARRRPGRRIELRERKALEQGWASLARSGRIFSL